PDFLPTSPDLPFPDTNWLFDPPDTLDPRFLRDFRELLVHFSKQDMKIIPSLISFEFFHRNRTVLPDLNGCIAEGRYQVATDPDKRRKFFDTVLDKFLDISEDFRETILAWELMNEPHMITGPFSTYGLFHPPEVHDDDMTAFLREGLDRIEN